MDTLNDTIREFYNKGLVLMPLIDNRPMLRNWQNLTIRDKLDLSNVKSVGWVISDSHVVIDVDMHGEDDGEATFLKLQQDFKVDLEELCGFIVRSTNDRGGRHLYFKTPESGFRTKNYIQGYKEGLEFKSKGRYVVTPNSLRASGKQYRILKGNLGNITVLPNSIWTLIKRTETEKDINSIGWEGVTSKIDLNRFREYLNINYKQHGIQEGHRNNELFNICCVAKEMGVAPKECLEELVELNKEYILPPVPFEHLVDKINEAAKYSRNSFGQQSVSSLLDEVEIKEPSKKKLNWIEQLKRDSKGNIYQNKFQVYNAIIFLKNLPETKGRLAVNLFSKSTVWSKNPDWYDGRHFGANGLRCSDDDYYRIRSIFNKHDFDASKAVIREACRTVGLDYGYHPLKDYLSNLTWDGKERIEEFFISYCGVDDNEYTRIVSKKFFVAIINRIFEPGCKFDHMLVLVGKQGFGKSDLLRRLCIKPDWFLEGATDLNNKDAIFRLQGKILCEDAELEAFNRTRSASVKAFLTTQMDEARVPHDTEITTFPRQCIMCGTSNPSDFLKDETGERRIWPLLIKKQRADFEAITQVVPQLYAEAIYWYEKKYPIYMSVEEEAIFL